MGAPRGPGKKKRKKVFMPALSDAYEKKTKNWYGALEKERKSSARFEKIFINKTS